MRTGHQATIFEDVTKLSRRWKADGQMESDLKVRKGDLQMPSSGSQQSHLIHAQSKENLRELKWTGSSESRVVGSGLKTGALLQLYIKVRPTHTGTWTHLSWRYGNVSLQGDHMVPHLKERGVTEAWGEMTCRTEIKRKNPKFSYWMVRLSPQLLSLFSFRMLVTRCVILLWKNLERTQCR